jgi:hypothetical protein
MEHILREEPGMIIGGLVLLFCATVAAVKARSLRRTR